MNEMQKKRGAEGRKRCTSRFQQAKGLFNHAGFSLKQPCVFQKITPEKIS